MRKRIIYIQLILFFAAVIAGCKEPYNPPAIKSTTSYLVVDGVINTGNDLTVYKLSRTVQVGSSSPANPEAGATVTVENNAGAVYPLHETTPGIYSSAAPLNASSTAQYRLRIVTANKAVYLSDYVVVKNSPPIDTVGFNVQTNDVQVYVNTHDPNNATHYYRWDYGETWKFHVPFESDAMYVNGQVVFRPDSLSNFICYTSDSSSNVTLASSAQLTKDVIYQAPMTVIPETSEKINMEYSILVRQYALTPDAFAFWQLIKTNTENLGSIFDAQPSEAASNIHNINDPKEAVIGYISAGATATKRIFIQNSQLPQQFGALSPIYNNCVQDTIPVSAAASYLNGSPPLYLPLQTGITSVLISFCACVTPGYIVAGRLCSDCTTRGVKAPPPFWK